MTTAPLQVILADDEPLARERLRLLLRAEPGYQLVGEATDGAGALSLIRQTRPDIALLDIQLPALDGLNVVSALQQDSPAVIFVTAFAEHAVRAFEAQAVDYLLKPVSAERFSEALHRARRRCECRPRLPSPREVTGQLIERERLVLKSTHGKVILALDEIVYAASADSSCEVFTMSRSWKLGESLRSLGLRLPHHRFVRISRFALVNLDHVIAVQPKSHGDQYLLLRNQTRLTIARTRRIQVLDCLKRFL